MSLETDSVRCHCDHAEPEAYWISRLPLFDFELGAPWMNRAEGAALVWALTYCASTVPREQLPVGEDSQCSGPVQLYGANAHA